MYIRIHYVYTHLYCKRKKLHCIQNCVFYTSFSLKYMYQRFIHVDTCTSSPFYDYSIIFSILPMNTVFFLQKFFSYKWCCSGHFFFSTYENIYLD